MNQQEEQLERSEQQSERALENLGFWMKQAGWDDDAILRYNGGAQDDGFGTSNESSRPIFKSGLMIKVAAVLVAIGMVVLMCRALQRRSSSDREPSSSKSRSMSRSRSRREPSRSRSKSVGRSRSRSKTHRVTPSRTADAYDMMQDDNKSRKSSRSRSRSRRSRSRSKPRRGNSGMLV
mmetsp:Transcript_23320/g.35817  ORF Transcript_23320/g.35817 Transcript_23320/m.35817 type:complete len:178 (-) Transcript_23320:87-620(-)